MPQPQCIRIKRNGERCKLRAVKGYTVCQKHGAGSPYKGRPGGINKRYLPGGRNYSQVLPQRMLSRYKEALTDPERLALDNEIALVDTRIMDILGRVDTGEAGRHWAQVGEAYTSLINSMRENDTAGVSAALEKMNREIGMGVSDYAAWKEIIDLITSRRRLVESERKRLMQMKALVAIDEAINWVRAFIETVRGHVDQETMVRIQGDFAKLAAKTGDYASPEIDEIIEGEVVVEEKE